MEGANFSVPFFRKQRERTYSKLLYASQGRVLEGMMADRAI